MEFVIQKASNGEIYQKDLESFLSIRGSSVTSLINNLERDGYIRRESVKFDGRYKHLAPTKKALAIQAEISQRIDRYMDSLFAGVPEADLKVYESVLDQMTQNVK